MTRRKYNGHVVWFIDMYAHSVYYTHVTMTFWENRIRVRNENNSVKTLNWVSLTPRIMLKYVLAPWSFFKRSLIKWPWWRWLWWWLRLFTLWSVYTLYTWAFITLIIIQTVYYCYQGLILLWRIKSLFLYICCVCILKTSWHTRLSRRIRLILRLSVPPPTPTII